MKFLHPNFLFALFTIAIPVLIHFFNFRRYKTVYFSHVGFLKNIKKESKKKSRLKHLLLLMARILSLFFLVFAFAQPTIPVSNISQNPTSNIVGIYIDNSFSMSALSEQGQLLEQARNKAAAIGQAYPPGTQFKLFTNDLEARHQHLFSKDQFIQQVSDIHASPQVIPFSRIHNRFAQQNQETDGNTLKSLYFISDFQRNITDPHNFNPAKILSYFLPLRPNEVNNLYIDSCWMEVPAHGLKQEENIFVRIKNNSDEDYQNLPLNLYLNDSLKSITNFSVKAQNEITANLKYKNVSGGIQLGKVEITDYPFTHDNNWYISYFVEPRLKALVLFNKSKDSREGLNYISALFKNDDYIDLEQMDVQRLQISKLSEFNTIFLVNPDQFSTGLLNELASVTESGSSVVLFPRTDDNYAMNNSFLSKFGAAQTDGIDTTRLEISGIDFNHRFFENVFQKKEENPIQPQIQRHLKFQENIRTNESPLLWFQNGDKALSMLPYGKGTVWTFSFPLKKKNETFARNILFVPVLYNIVLNSLPDQKISYTIGRDNTYLLPQRFSASISSSFEIKKRATGDRFIPGINITDQGVRLEFAGLIEADGHYMITAGEETLSALAYNYNREESDLRYFTARELQEKVETENHENVMIIDTVDNKFSEVYNKIQKGKQLWKWCIWLALLFLIAELIIARFWK